MVFSLLSLVLTALRSSDLFLSQTDLARPRLSSFQERAGQLRCYGWYLPDGTARSRESAVLVLAVLRILFSAERLRRDLQDAQQQCC
jgi:hypothetical protein